MEDNNRKYTIMDLYNNPNKVYKVYKKEPQKEVFETLFKYDDSTKLFYSKNEYTDYWVVVSLSITDMLELKFEEYEEEMANIYHFSTKNKGVDMLGKSTDNTLKVGDVIETEFGWYGVIQSIEQKPLSYVKEKKEIKFIKRYDKPNETLLNKMFLQLSAMANCCCVRESCADCKYRYLRDNLPCSADDTKLSVDYLLDKCKTDIDSRNNIINK